MSPSADPVASAAAVWSRSCRESVRAWRFIQTIIQVTAPTATTPMIVSSPSCCWRGSSSPATWSAMPAAAHTAAAPRTPTHTQRSASRRCCEARNAAMMPTMRDASSPSRRPMTKVESTGSPVVEARRGGRDLRSPASRAGERRENHSAAVGIRVAAFPQRCAVSPAPPRSVVIAPVAAGRLASPG